MSSLVGGMLPPTLILPKVTSFFDEDTSTPVGESLIPEEVTLLGVHFYRRPIIMEGPHPLDLLED